MVGQEGCRAVLACLWMVMLVGGAQAARSGTSISSPSDYAHELTAGTFNSTLKAVTAPWALVEFYAHWCPACRNYKPYYERIAQLFNRLDAVHAGEVYVAKVDCADQASSTLCERFAITHYPTLYWGPPKKVASTIGPLKGTTEVEAVSAGDVRTAEALLKWINKHVGKEYSLLEATMERPKASATDGSEMVEMAASVNDIEEATATAFQIMVDERKMMGSSSRDPFIKFLQLLVVHHPSKRCRSGSADLLVNVAELWPSGQHPTAALRDHPICGNTLPRGHWVLCGGETRAYSCGLWMLFHALSVRVDDSESHAAILAIHAFVRNFFNCELCRQHFLDISSRMKMNGVLSRRDLVLWLWRAHNEVNMRVAKEEAASGTGNPKFPKGLWPTKQQCGGCRVVASTKQQDTGKKKPEWDEAAVYTFLMDWYGISLKMFTETGSKHLGMEDGAGRLFAEVGSDSGNSESTIAVLRWAAVGITIASCVFGLATCIWRVQQKKQKY